MSTIDQNQPREVDDRSSELSDVLDGPAFAGLLAEENVRFTRLGVRSGVISIDGAGLVASEVWLQRAVRLLERSIRPTDRLGVTSDHSIAVLLAPIQTIAEVDRFANQLSVQLDVAGLGAAIGYAHRRSDEDLLDTWARSDAQADRALARNETRGLHLG